jgi:hypothetical protein
MGRLTVSLAASAPTRWASASGKDVAVGYGDPAFFRRLFKRTTGLTPAAYRRKYATIVGRGEIDSVTLPRAGVHRVRGEPER